MAANAAEAPATLTLDERGARALVLVQALELADTDGRLIGNAEREQLEHEALQATRDPARQQGPEPTLYLRERAARFVAALDKRDPRLAALQRHEPWHGLLAWGAPALALVLGVALDRIDNPQQVNMLSPPLLGFLLWNLLVYLGLLLAPLWPRLAGGFGLAALVRRWLAHAPAPGAVGRPLRGRVHADVATQFRLRWWRIGGRLEGWRIQQALHAAAAAWGIGLGLSIVLGGLVREYRVGWESTLLDVSQVHAFLQALFAPVVALLPLEPFSIADLERMHFRSGVDVPREEARRWIGLYLGLLALVVVIPRLALALYAAWRRRWAARALTLDLREPYFAETLARVSPARVVLGLVTADDGAGRVLLQVLRQAAAHPEGEPPGPGLPWPVLATARGDELRVVRLALDTPAPPGAAPTATGALGWLRLGSWRSRAAATPVARPATAQPQGDEADAVLVAARTPEDLVAAAPVLRSLGRPVLVLHEGEEADGHVLRGAAQRERLDAQVLALERCARRWTQEAALREAVCRTLPRHRSAGAARLMQCWRERHQGRFEESMRLLAVPLLLAARASQALPGGALNLRHLVDAAEREQGQQARQQAIAAIAQRLSDAQAHAMRELARLHGVPYDNEQRARASDGAAVETQGFVVRQSIPAPQAGMAGAASGAASGAAIDLMTGGMTLGAAAALGALVGGAGAMAAAAWKNRSVAAGAGAQVQPGETLLLSSVEETLLRYLAVIHAGRDAQAQLLGTPVPWHDEVHAAVQDARDDLAALGTQARAAKDDLELVPGVAQRLKTLAERVLARLDGVPDAPELLGELDG